MRRYLEPLAWLVLAVAAAGASACSSSGGAADAGDDRYGIRPPAEGGGDDSSADASPGIVATMRLAHLSPGLPPIDFCWRSAGAATYNGPVLGTPADAGAGDASSGGADATLDGGSDTGDEVGDAVAYDAASDATTADAEADSGPSDGGIAALSFGHMTGDVGFPTSGTFDIALVQAGVLSCDHPLLVEQVTLDAGKRSTVVVMGLAKAEAGADDALSLVAFVDDTMTDALQARVRIVNAALGGADGSPGAGRLAVSVGKTLVASSVDPKQASTQATTPAVDSLGYASVAAVGDPAAIALVASDEAGTAGSWTTPSVMLDVQAGTVHTGFVASLPQGELGVLWCTEVKTSSPLAGCALLHASR
jgi:hypothetical protein